MTVWLPASERSRCIGQRDDELFPDGADQRLVRPRDRRSRTGRLRGDGPARRRPAARESGVPGQPPAGYRHRDRARDPRRGVGAARRRLSRSDRRGARLRLSTPRQARKSLVKIVDPAAPSIPAPDAISRALDLLASPQRPLAILGKGAAYAQADFEIRSFIETTGIPFLPMSMAKGLLPDDHPDLVAAARSYVIGNADVVLVAGARLNWLLSHRRAPLWNESARLDPDRHLADRDRQQPRDRGACDRRHQIGVRRVQRRAEDGFGQAPGGVDRRDRQAQNAKYRTHGGPAQRRPEPDEFFVRPARGAERAPDPARCLHRQRGRQHARFRPQHHRHAPAAASPR